MSYTAPAVLALHARRYGPALLACPIECLRAVWLAHAGWARMSDTLSRDGADYGRAIYHLDQTGAEPALLTQTRGSPPVPLAAGAEFWAALAAAREVDGNAAPPAPAAPPVPSAPVPTGRAPAKRARPGDDKQLSLF
ncbi:MAG: hypothetical protein WCF85_10815 [Rhodospirillaceae bacterium]